MITAQLADRGIMAARPSDDGAARPVRVAFVVHGMNQGGYERCVAHLCNHLDGGRFEPLIICLDRRGPAAGWLERDDVRVIELGKRPGNDLGVIRGFAAVLREQRIDIVQSHNWGTLLETVLARRRAGTPVHVHAERGTVLGQIEAKGLRMKLRGMAAKWALKRTDAVVTNARAVAGRVAERCGYPAEAIHVIPNGVKCPLVDNAMAARREVRRELGISETAFVAGSIGRLHLVKGFGLAITALARLAESGCNAHLVVVGEGAERDQLTHSAVRLGVRGRLHLAGHRNDIGRWLAAFDVYVNTSRSEGMSQSLVEAMAAGLPLVATDVGDNAAVVGAGDAACGVVVPPGDAEALAAALVSLAGDAGMRQLLSARAKARHAAEFSFEQMIKRFESLYVGLFSALGTRHRPIDGRRVRSEVVGAAAEGLPAK